jgi:hypothetical protein
MTIRVVNKANHKPTPNDVYIGRGWGKGRGSIWGNPFNTKSLKVRLVLVWRGRGGSDSRWRTLEVRHADPAQE